MCQVTRGRSFMSFVLVVSRIVPVFTFLAFSAGVLGDEAFVSPPLADNDEPILRVQTEVPRSHIASIAFSPDGKFLYAAGWDKTVHVWTRQDGNGKYVASPERMLRLPIGPGEYGRINTMALSTDGTLLAVGGVSIMRHGSGFRDQYAGLMIPPQSLTKEQRLDRGVVYLFNTATCQLTHEFRGCRDEVVGLTFVQGDNEWLIAASLESALDRNVPVVRNVRVFNTNTGRNHSHCEMPDGEVVDPIPSLCAAAIAKQRFRVAIAWNDNQVFLWDVDKNNGTFRTPLPKKALDCRSVCVEAGKPSSFLLGARATPLSGGDWHGKVLSIVESSSDPVPKVLAPELFWPTHVASTSTNNGKSSRIVALFAKEKRQPVDGKRFVWWLGTNETAAKDAWNYTQLPPLDSARLAVCENMVAIARHHPEEILLYDAAGLRGGNAKPMQVLAQPSSPIDDAHFISRGKERGLRLRLRNRAELVLNLTNGDFEREKLDSWRPDVLKAEGFQWRRSGTDASRIIVRETSRLDTELPLPAHCRWTDRTVVRVNNRQIYPHPLLVVGLDVGGAPQVNVYDTHTGEWLRRLSGDSGQIISLSASEDGRFIVGVTNDGVVSIWRLDDLEQSVSNQGMLRGVMATDSNEGIRIDQFDAVRFPRSVARYAQAGLAEGDLLEGFVRGGALHQPEQAWELLMKIATLKPGTKVQLQVRRTVRQGVQVAKPITVPIGLAVDERKPHFQFVCLHDTGLDRWSYIGWTPLGPYDTNDPAAAELVGWHFNPSEGQKEAKFVPLSEYRHLRRRGLLGHLLTHDQPPDPPQPPAVSADTVFSLAQEDLEPDSNGVINVPVGKKVQVTALLSDYHPYDIERVDIRFASRQGGRPIAVNMSRSPHNPAVWLGEFMASVEDGAGIFDLRGSVGTVYRHDSRLDFSQSARLRFQNEMHDPQEVAEISTTPPVVTVGEPDESDKVRVNVDYFPPNRALPVNAQFYINQKPQGSGGIPIRFDRGAVRIVSSPLQLTAGENTVVVRLTNDQGREWVSRNIEVRIAKAPFNVAVDVESSAGNAGTVRCQVSSPNQPTRVHWNRVGEPSREMRQEFTRVLNKDIWETRIIGLPLIQGTNDFELRVENGDGISEKVTFSLKAEPVAAEPPRVWLQAESKFTSPLRRATIPVRIDVARPTDDVELHWRINDRAPQSRRLQRQNGKFEFELSLILDEHRTNQIAIFARDVGSGLDSELKVLQVEVATRPLEIVVQKVRESREADAPCDLEEMHPQAGVSRAYGLPRPVDGSIIRVSGIVRGDAVDLAPIGGLRVWVNGFLQTSVDLRKANQGEKGVPFEVELFFDATDNRVVFEIPNRPAEPTLLTAICNHPELARRLHILVVNVGPEPMNELKGGVDHLVESLGQFKQDDVRTHVLSAEVIQAFQVRQHFLRLQRQSWSVRDVSPLYLMYFHGRAFESSERQIALLTKSHLHQPADPSDHLPGDYLERVFGGLRGGHLLFLDVLHDRDEPVGAWVPGVGLGVVRADWKLPAQVSHLELKSRMLLQIGEVLSGRVGPVQLGQLADELRDLHGGISDLPDRLTPSGIKQHSPIRSAIGIEELVVKP